MQSLSAAEKPALDHTVDHTANAAHHAVDTLADQALTGVGKVSGSLHVAVNRAADAVADGADWVARVPPRVRRTKARVGSATFAAIKARPFITLGGAVALGFVFGRLARR
jgi:hypothetical protein